MRSGWVVAGAVLSIGAGLPAGAQSVGRMVESDVRNGVGDIVGVWVSPFHAQGRDWLSAAALVGLSAAVSPLDDDVDRYMVDHARSNSWSVLKELREGGLAFSGKTITPVVAGLYVVGVVTKSRAIRDGVWGCLASYTAGSVARNYVFYQVIGRQRPDSSRRHDNGYVAPPARQGDQYDFQLGPKKWGMHSLPAGHVANVMSCASFLGNRFHMGYAEPIPYLVALGVGAGRIVDRRHWTSDTVIGMIFGYAVGKEVAKRSLRRAEEQRTADVADPAQGMFVTPVRGGLGFGWQTTF